MELSELFKLQAEWTHDKLSSGYFHCLMPGEEAITDINLISISDQSEGMIVTRKFTKKEESNTSGADWLWYIGEPGSWFPILVQAKIANPKTGHIQYLNYKDGEQCEKLKYYAQYIEAYPFYCFYSDSYRYDTSVTIENEVNKELSISINRKHWACALSCQYFVDKQKHIGSKHIKDFINFSYPWHLPFELADYIGGGLLGTRMAKSVDWLQTILYQQNSLKRWKKMNWGDPDIKRIIKDHIPMAIVLLLFSKERKLIVNKHIPNVGIISNQPISKILSENEDDLRRIPYTEVDKIISEFFSRKRKKVIC